MAVNNPTTVKATGQPPIAGQVILAAGTNITLTQTANQISIAAAAGGGGTQGTSVVDFGTGKIDTSVAVTGQAAILSGSLPEAWPNLTATANNLVDSLLAEDIQFFAGDIIPSTGFTIYAFCRQGRAFGQYNVNWRWS